ncbi:gamma-butyrobetaine hydroxylase-like domain-containing protein [Thiolapillus sp.]
MTDTDHPQPDEIKLHQKSRLLSISFSDGKSFRLPCEYLRIHSPAAEVAANELPETGKQDVNIKHMEPQGSYALRIEFDDGHDTGIYSWERLYDLGLHQEKYWQDYLDKLEAHGIGYAEQDAATDERENLTLKILYFSYLVNKLGTQEEVISLPSSRVKSVRDLLDILAVRKLERGYLLAENTIRVTVNRQFAELFTRLEDGDEIGIVPNSPNPPASPRK